METTNATNATTDEELTAALVQVLTSEALAETDLGFGRDLTVDRVDTFEEAGVLTTNQGLVVRLSDGTEFQVSVVRSR